MIKNSTLSPENSILLRGYQKKLKTMKKKYFVLFNESPSNCARLEYFDSEKKFNSGCIPKRTIKIKNCLNINRRLDTKYDHVIGLSTKEGGFGIVLESEDEMAKWLEALITLQRNEQSLCEKSGISFEHVWQVMIQHKGMAVEKGIIGNYHVGLTPKSLTFIKIVSQKQTESRIKSIEFLLTTIRRCGDSQCVFYMELGRQSIVGPGELWMETGDALTARNMHNMILSAMSLKTDPGNGPMRKRSSSANEASKPKSLIHSTDSHLEKESTCQNNILYGRERCESLPSPRNRKSGDYRNRSSVSLTTQLQNSRLQINLTGYFKNEKAISTTEEQDDDREGTHLLQFPPQEQTIRSSSTGSRDDYNKVKVFSDSEEDFRKRVRAFSAGSQGILSRRNLRCNLTDCRSRIEEASSSDSNITKKSHELVNDDFITSTSSCVNENQYSLDRMSDLTKSNCPKDSENAYIASKNISPIKQLQVKNADNLAMLGTYISENDVCNLFSKFAENGYLEMRPVSSQPSNPKLIAKNKKAYKQVSALAPVFQSHTSSDENKEKCNMYESAAYSHSHNISIFRLNSFQSDNEENRILYDTFYIAPDNKKYSYLYELDPGKPQINSDAANMLLRQYLRSYKDGCFIWNQNELESDKERCRLEKSEIVIDDTEFILNSHFESSRFKKRFNSTHQYIKHISDVHLFAAKNNYNNLHKILDNTIKENHSGYANFKIQSYNQSQLCKICPRVSCKHIGRLIRHTKPNKSKLTNGEITPFTARMSIPRECLLQTLSLKHKNSIPICCPYFLSEFSDNCRIEPTNNDGEVIYKNSSNTRVISENYLYYASLDLNYCSFNKNVSADMDSKNLNSRTLCAYPPPLPVENATTNPGYAKISFINPE